MLRRMVGWVTQRALGRRNFWSDSNLKPEWWPKEHPFQNVRKNSRKSLIAVLEASNSSENLCINPDDIRDRSPRSSPAPERKIEPTLGESVTSDRDEPASSDVSTLERIDLEFSYDKDALSSDSDISFSHIEPPQVPTHFFPRIPDTPVKDGHSQDIITTMMEIPQQPDHTLDPIISLKDPFSRRLITQGEMNIFLHELSHSNTFLTDVTMNAFSVLILNQYPHLKGLQDTILSQKRRFTPSAPGSIQIHHDAPHWIVSRSDVNNRVYVYDSMYYGALSDGVKVQLASLYRREAPHDLDVIIEPIQQ